MLAQGLQLRLDALDDEYKAQATYAQVLAAVTRDVVAQPGRRANDPHRNKTLDHVEQRQGADLRVGLLRGLQRGGVASQTDRRLAVVELAQRDAGLVGRQADRQVAILNRISAVAHKLDD